MSTLLADKDDHHIVDYKLVRAWLFTAFFWLIFAPAVGIILSLLLTLPDWFGGSEWFNFGRLRPLHTNGVVFGAFSTFFLGLSYYIVPKLTGIRVVGEKWGWVNLVLWNLGLSLGMIMILMGFNTGLEVAEMPFPVAVGIEAVLIISAIQFIMTVARRIERTVYVSLWYLVAAFIWTIMSWALGAFILPEAIPGISNAAFHGLYLHYTVGLWITPAGYVLIYYFLPPAAGRPLYSHKLSLIGFWTLAFLYPLTGTHHYLFSSIADFTETIAIVASLALIVPVWTVTQNFFGTTWGKWKEYKYNHAVRFLLLGALFYLVGCTQGSLEALRAVQLSTHFTDFVIGHSHITIAGTFVLWGVGATYFLWPKLCGRDKVENDRLAILSWWFVLVGMVLMVAVLSIQGVIQGTMLADGAEFVDTVALMEPWWWARTVFGTMFDIGLAMSVAVFVQTWRNRSKGDGSVPEERERIAPAAKEVSSEAS